MTNHADDDSFGGDLDASRDAWYSDSVVTCGFDDPFTFRSWRAVVRKVQQLQREKVELKPFGTERKADIVASDRTGVMHELPATEVGWSRRIKPLWGNLSKQASAETDYPGERLLLAGIDKRGLMVYDLDQKAPVAKWDYDFRGADKATYMHAVAFCGWVRGRTTTFGNEKRIVAACTYNGKGARLFSLRKKSNLASDPFHDYEAWVARSTPAIHQTPSFVFDVEMEAELCSLHGGAQIACIDFSPHDGYVACLNDGSRGVDSGEVIFFDLEKGPMRSGAVNIKRAKNYTELIVDDDDGLVYACKGMKEVALIDYRQQVSVGSLLMPETGGTIGAVSLLRPKVAAGLADKPQVLVGQWDGNLSYFDLRMLGDKDRVPSPAVVWSIKAMDGNVYSMNELDREHFQITSRESSVRVIKWGSAGPKNVASWMVPTMLFGSAFCGDLPGYDSLHSRLLEDQVERMRFAVSFGYCCTREIVGTGGRALGSVFAAFVL